MPNYMVFSLVDVAGNPGSQELWKFRGSFLANTPREANMQVAEVDATENGSENWNRSFHLKSLEDLVADHEKKLKGHKKRLAEAQKI